MKSNQPSFLPTRRKGETALFVGDKEIKMEYTGTYNLDSYTASLFAVNKIPVGKIIKTSGECMGKSYTVIISRHSGSKCFIRVGDFKKLNDSLTDIDYSNKFFEAASIKDFTKEALPQGGIDVPKAVFFYFKAKTVKAVLTECDRVMTDFIHNLNQ